MRKFVSLVLIIFLFLFINLTTSQAQNNNYVQGKIQKIFTNACQLDANTVCEYAKIRIEDGTTISAQIKKQSSTSKYNYREGDDVWIQKIEQVEGTTLYLVNGHNRQSNTIYLVIIFFILCIVIAKWRGFLAFIALAINILVILFVLLPSLFWFPEYILFITFILSCLLLTINIFLSHGFNKVSFIAFCGGMFSLLLIFLLGNLASIFLNITGMGPDNMSFLVSMLPANISFSDLFLSGFLIGAVGALDDVTITQSSLVQELYISNPKVNFKELFQKSLYVGNQHLVSMINTLFLAFMGSGFTVLMLFHVSNQNNFWEILSRDSITEEIVRMLISSMGLLFAIPFTTFIACILIGNVTPLRKFVIKYTLLKYKNIVWILIILLLVLLIMGGSILLFNKKTNAAVMLPANPKTSSEKKVVTDADIAAVVKMQFGQPASGGVIKYASASHMAIDLGNPNARDIYAVADGIVEDAGFNIDDGVYGNGILIKHSDAVETFYARLESIAIKPGDMIKKGQVIGKMGDTGQVGVGIHLHFEIRIYGQRQNPAVFL